MNNLISSYLEHNHIDSLRFQLCDIIFSHYKGPIFFSDKLLVEKKKVLQQVEDFIQDHPEIVGQGNAFWYPYSHVSPHVNHQLYHEFYHNTAGGITHFSATEKDSYLVSDYLFDPLKLHFFTMCTDITQNHVSSKNSQEIFSINDQIFLTLLRAVGDPMSYNGLNTLQHIEIIIAQNREGQKKAEDNTTDSIEFRDLMIDSYRTFNQNTYLLEPAITACRAYHLEQNLPQKERSRKNKI